MPPDTKVPNCRLADLPTIFGGVHPPDMPPDTKVRYQNAQMSSLYEGHVPCWRVPVMIAMVSSGCCGLTAAVLANNDTSALMGAWQCTWCYECPIADLPTCRLYLGVSIHLTCHQIPKCPNVIAIRGSCAMLACACDDCHGVVRMLWPHCSCVSKQ
eukprot:150396_1